MCDDCGAPFSIELEHALDYCIVGLVTHRHNEVWDAFGDLASLVWSSVIKEPVVCDGSASADTLIADLSTCGVWEPQTEALFDIRVVDTCTIHSYYFKGRYFQNSVNTREILKTLISKIICSTAA